MGCGAGTGGGLRDPPGCGVEPRCGLPPFFFGCGFPVFILASGSLCDDLAWTQMDVETI
jgi:hypothetical protein